MSAGEEYCAVIIDIVKSTQMDEQRRFAVQKTLEGARSQYNCFYEQTLAANLDFSGGDQLQALFLNPRDAYEFICDFREKMFPIEFRIGLGVGNWSLRFPGNNTNKQDGTSYHHARSAYEYASKFKKNIAFCSDRDTDAFVNVLINQEYALFNAQSSQQKNVFKQYKSLYPIRPVVKREDNVAVVWVDKGSQQVVADKLASSRQNVNKLVRTGCVYEQRVLQGAILLRLSELYSTKGDAN